MRDGCTTAVERSKGVNVKRANCVKWKLEFDMATGERDANKDEKKGMGCRQWVKVYGDAHSIIGDFGCFVQSFCTQFLCEKGMTGPESTLNPRNDSYALEAQYVDRA